MMICHYFNIFFISYDYDYYYYFIFNFYYIIIYVNNDYYYKYGYIDKILDDNKFVIKFRGNEDIAFVSKSRLFKGVRGLNSVFSL